MIFNLKDTVWRSFTFIRKDVTVERIHKIPCIILNFIHNIFILHAHLFSFLCCPLCVFTFWVPCCDVRYDFRIKTMFGSSLPPVVCRRAHVLFTFFYTLFVYSGVQHILCCGVVLFFFVLCTQCWQFLWIVHFLLPLQFSLTII